MTEARDPRVYFAAERTLLAWIRTGLAMMGFGFVVARFGLFLVEIAAARGVAVPSSQGNASLWAGTALVLLGVSVNVIAAVDHARFRRSFRQGAEEAPDRRFPVSIALAAIVALIGAAMAAYLMTS